MSENRPGFTDCGIPATGPDSVLLEPRNAAWNVEGFSLLLMDESKFTGRIGRSGIAGNRWQCERLACSCGWACCSAAACSRHSSLRPKQPHAARPEAAGQCALCAGGDPRAYRRHIVDYHRKEAPGTIVVDTDARYLYYVLPTRQGDPLRRDRRRRGAGRSPASPRSAARKSGRPGRRPPTSRSGSATFPIFVGGGPHNPLGARGIYLFRATRTRCTASTAPTSRNTSARRFRRAASA